MKTTGAEILIRLLERQGIRVIAGIPGGANLPIYDALSRSRIIRHVLARHEQGAGFIAQGMARITGRPEVCFATSGPGATNVLTALADAKLDSVPVVCITGQVPTAMIGTDAFQEIDTYGMSLPITKHNFLVRSAAQLLEVVPEAFRIAASGRPGPVLIDIPKDVQLERIEVGAWPDPGLPDAPRAPNRPAVERAARLINEARRPVLYLGGGIIHADAAEKAVRFAEDASIPVTTTLMALGAVPTDHPLYIGMLGMHAARYTNLVLEEADLLIVMGARFDDRATGRISEFCPKARVIHVDIDASELNKNRPTHVGIVGDVGDVIDALLPRVHPTTRRVEWLGFVDEMRRRHPLPTPGADDPLSPYGLVLETARQVGDEAVVTTDVGQHQMWAAQVYPFRRPRRWLTSGGLGAMGFGLPAAIGAALADPGRTVVCFSGDGSLLMNMQELATAAEEGVNVKVVLMDNRSLGLVHQQQDLFYGGRIFATDFRVAVDFVRIAEGLGVRAVDLADTADPAALLAEVLRIEGPALIRVPIDIREGVYPMVPPGAANREMIEERTAIPAIP